MTAAVRAYLAIKGKKPPVHAVARQFKVDRSALAKAIKRHLNG